MGELQDETSFYQELAKTRRHFHSIAELSGQETETSKEVVRILKTLKGCSVVENVGGTGILAVFKAQEPGPTVAFRAELDALPIIEVNDFDHKSKREGISHKCGHDGHLTTLIGLAHKLNDQPPKKGRVILLFQPAEENGKGAKAVFEDPKFKDYQPDLILAWHNLPGYPLGKIVYRHGSFTPAVTSLIIKFYGKTSHAAEPEFGINPALAMSKVVQESLLLQSNDINAKDFSVITPVHMTLGDRSYGISAGYGEVHLTIRTWTQHTLDALVKNIKYLSRQTGDESGLSVAFEQTEDFNANENSKEGIEKLEQAIEVLKMPAETREYPFKWGEDFGLFTQHFSGAMFGIGSGEDCPALHNPDYDFPDDILKTGVTLLDQVVTNMLR